MTITEEYGNGYDPYLDEEDLGNADFYCEHGTFIGNSVGGDYMCGWCEDGVPYADYLRYVERMRHDVAMKNATTNLFHAVGQHMTKDCPQFIIDMAVAIWVKGIYR